MANASIKKSWAKLHYASAQYFINFIKLIKQIITSLDVGKDAKAETKA
jgi:hypothetical protein